MNTVKICALRSGSSGNAIFVGSGNTRLLIDAGVSLRDIELALQEIGEQPDQLTGVLVTHEHTDHARSIGALMRRYRVPLYTNAGTFDALRGTLGKYQDGLVRLFDSNQPFTVGDLQVSGFRTSHDAAESVAFKVDTDRGSVAVCTDLGWPDPALLAQLSSSRLIFVEANYDPTMLAAGPYPQMLKRRIASDYGHLSNLDSARAILHFLSHGTDQFILSHLSKENNYPELALQTVRDHLLTHDARIDHDLQVAVAKRFKVSDPVEWH
ncbi:MAG: metallo-beta-lactamase family protein [Firmicutes bacterium]|nr:metallo-beta-lactamase family protein [Bacillota bacterium]